MSNSCEIKELNVNRIETLSLVQYVLEGIYSLKKKKDLATPTAAAGSSFIFRSASVLHLNDIFSVLGHSDPQIIVAVASQRPPVPEMSLFSIGPPSAPWDQLAPPPLVVPQLMPAITPHWLLPPATSP